MFKKIWNDPVWSKVIATAIIALSAVGLTFWNTVYVFVANVIKPNDEVNINSTQNTPIVSEPKIVNQKLISSEAATTPIDIKKTDLSKKIPPVGKSNSDILSQQTLQKETPTTNEEDRKSSTNSILTTNNKEAVTLALSALKGEVGSYRLQSIAALLSTLPNNLNTKEIALLLENSVGSTRNEILKLLVTKIKTNSLSAENMSDILDQEVGSNRFNCVKTIAPYIRLPITGSQAASILGTEVGSSRVNVLKIIAPLIKHPLSEPEIKAVLEGVVGSSKTEAISALFNNKISTE